MEEVLSQTLADTADAAVAAVIYILLTVVIPELADTTVVLRTLLIALLTPLRGGLGMSAQHA